MVAATTILLSGVGCVSRAIQIVMAGCEDCEDRCFACVGCCVAVLLAHMMTAKAASREVGDFSDNGNSTKEVTGVSDFDTI